jgi:hypothetical protein
MRGRQSERLLTLVLVRFSLISRCTHPAHAAFQLIEKAKLSLQSIMGKLPRLADPTQL